MNLEILLSCMNQHDLGIVGKSGISSDVLIINQSHKDDYIQEKRNFLIRMISTTEKGLSRSRNMAIRRANNEICLICDDDEKFVPGYENEILKAFQILPDADVLIFQIDYKKKKRVPVVKRVNYLSALQISSVQIAFRRRKIIDNNIFFDETVGSGVSKAGGEEVLFLYECMKKKLRIFYYPSLIAQVGTQDSKWFKGYSKIYFYDRGVVTRKMMGRVLALVYGAYFLLFKYRSYRKDISVGNALTELIKGIFHI